MTDLDANDVMAAAAAWIWMPDDAETVDTEDYLLVAFPAFFSNPTQVLRTSSQRSAEELVAEVREHVRRWDRPSVAWWCSPATSPADLESALVEAGGTLDETLAVLARPVDDLEPADARFDVRPVLDPASLRDHEVVAIDAFGGEMPSDARIEAEASRLRASFDEGTAVTVVAYLDGVPVGTGGLSIADGFGRLWSGATVARARDQGVYAAVIATRAAWAREHGATALLTKGRVDTSASILRRAGFTAYGEERSYRLRA